MSLQKQSWIRTMTGKYHYQKKGLILCGRWFAYALFEESNPPKNIRCQNCEKRLL